MNLYLVRHGESTGNVQAIHQGENVPLSESGIKQVEQVANRLKDKNITVIYASPHLRTKHTAEVLAKELDLPIEFWDQLKERRRPSIVEGLKYNDPLASEIYELTKINQVKPDWKHSDDESYNEILNRAKEVEQQLLNKHSEDNVICVSHIGMIIMIAIQLVLQDKLTPEVFWQFYSHAKYSNTGITHLTYSEKFGWILVTWNDTSHL